MEVDYKDTAAYKIFRQVLNHTWGSDEKISSDEFVKLYKTYILNGGSWEAIISGDMDCVKILENTLDDFIKQRHGESKV